MRTNLILHFHCSECGKQLRIVNDLEGRADPKSESTYYQNPKEPTGAKCHYTPTISIEPCRACIEKYTLPAKKLCAALKELRDGL